MTVFRDLQGALPERHGSALTADPRAELAHLAREGADSLFHYVERMAESVEGGARGRACAI